MSQAIEEKQILTFNEAKEFCAGEIRRLAEELPLGKNRIIRFEVKINSADLPQFLASNASNSKIYWSSRESYLPDRQGSFETAGLGISYALSGTSIIDYDAIFHELNRYLSGDNKNVKFFGGIAFNHTSIDKNWEEFGSYRFVLPRFEVLKRNQQTFFACNVFGNVFSAREAERILQELESLKCPNEKTSLMFPRLISRSDEPKKSEWIKKVDALIKRLKNKTLEKTVLARQSVFEFAENPDPWAILRELKSISPDCFHFCFSPIDAAAFIGASPERLYKRDGKTVRTEAIAGTRPRGRSSESDSKLKQELLNSPKELKEHQFVAEAIEDALEQVCTRWDMETKSTLLALKSGQHLLTSFKGNLKKDTDDAEILSLLHPTPAVAGCPTDKALKVIKQFEPFKRGWYAAPVGWVGFDSCEFAVGIRSGLILNNKLFVYAGAGIVEDSNPQDEWDEVETKIGSFIKIFESSKL
ncbi:MAG: isochorismate synthase [Candidatus Omnitrophota bacterium]